MFDDSTARTLEPAPEAVAGEASGAHPHKNLITMPGHHSETQSTEQPNVGVAPKEEHHMEDFATALESYTLETEPAPSEDNVFKGTVVKITTTHVVVNIGFKSEGLVPIAEVTTSEGQVKFQPGDEIEVMVQRGEKEEGTVLTGTVKNLTDYGAFVDLGGIDGLLHITDMSWGRLTHPRDLVHVGDQIQVKVLKFDKDKLRVSLGFKQLTPDPWLDAAERYPIGARVKGRILSVTDYGAFVELEQGIEGLVHVSEMSWSKRMKHPSKLVIVGNEIDCVVLNVNPTERRISLGLKQLESNPWERLHEKYPINSTAEGRVRNLTDFGAFIEIEDGIDGLVHVSNLSWTKRVKHPSEVLKKGEKIKAAVLGIEPEQRRLSLGVKQLQPDAWENFFNTHRIGDVVRGKVLRLAQFGAFVEIAEGVEGLCHNSEATDSTGGSVKLEAGQEHDFKVIKMNAEEKKVGLSLRAVGAEASRADVEAYKHPASSATATLGDIVNWKRAGNDQE